VTRVATDTPRHTPSVSELQAALVAARGGQFASPTVPTPAPAQVGEVTVAAAVGPPGPPPSGPGPGASDGAGVWLLGTHGGSGVRCLAAVLSGTRCAGKVWPEPISGNREPLVLVCRGSHRGLTSAQEYARAYRDGELAGGLLLLGVIVSADAPGRTPPALRRLERLLSGAAPVLAHAPWEPTWRVGPAQTHGGGEPLPWVTKLSQALTAAVGSAVLA
jgi:hypothetical protein